MKPISNNIIYLATSAPARLKTLEELLHSYRFNFTNEEELQRAVQAVLTEEGVSFVREYEITYAATPARQQEADGAVLEKSRPAGKDRIDFLVGDIGLEIKIGFSYAEVVRQLHRYAAAPEIACLMLLTSRLQHTMPKEISGKTLCTVNIGLTSSL